MQNQTTETQTNQTQISTSKDKSPTGEVQSEAVKTLAEQKVRHAAMIDRVAEEHLKRLSRVRLGHEAMMVDDANKNLAYNRASRDRGMREILGLGSGGDSTPETQNSDSPASGEQKSTLDSLLGGLDNMINLGDIHVSSTQTTPKSTQPEGNPLGKLAKAGIAAALIGSGVGTGYGIPLLLNAFKPDKKPVVSSPKNTDTYNEIRLHPPKTE